MRTFSRLKFQKFHRRFIIVSHAMESVQRMTTCTDAINPQGAPVGRSAGLDAPKYEMADPGFWLNHFRRNRLNRPEPQWNAPLSLPQPVIKLLVKSLEQYQLGDGGGPASLIAWNAESFRCSSKESEELVDLWFLEEKEHSRLLGGAVARLGGKPIQGHWSFSVFCGVRRWIGVDFELTVLLLTEIVSTIYYRLIQRHCQDEPMRAMCGLIMRDEAGHVAFHRARMALEGRNGKCGYGAMWEVGFFVLGYAAATMLWVNHARALCAMGATTQEFYSEIRKEIGDFVSVLRREASAENAVA
jgi:hypothetical protein